MLGGWWGSWTVELLFVSFPQKLFKNGHTAYR